MSNVTTVGLDISKRSFHLVQLGCAQLDETNEVVLRRKLRRSQLEAYMRKLMSSRVVMEACGSAHYWARKFESMGHTVKLLPPQHVKGYLRGQKNDFNDALAIAEASIHAAIRPVGIKTIEQQDEQAQHRMRSLLIRDRVALSNHIAGRSPLAFCMSAALSSLWAYRSLRIRCLIYSKMPKSI